MRGWLGPTLAVTILLAGCALQTAFGYAHDDRSGHAWGNDDAFISYRYARNLLRGEGLVYNPGERVEGYSNLLYVLLVVPGVLFGGGRAVYAYSVALNAASMAAALFVFHGHLRRRYGEPRALAAAGLFALFPGMWVAVASGLETPLVVLLQILIWTFLEREKAPVWALPIALVLAVLARADGFALPGLAILWLGLAGRRREALRAAAVVSFTFGAHVAARLAYYGWPLPNTYYAKVDGPVLARTAAALRQLASQSPGNGLLPYLLIVALVSALWLWRARRLPPPARVPPAAVLGPGLIAYWLYVGGDVFGDRFLLLLVPLALDLLLELAAGRRRWPAGTLAALLVAQAALLLGQAPARFTLHKYDRWITLGEYLGRRHAGELLAVDSAGKVPYVSDLRAVDMLGLNDATIAHLRVDRFADVGHLKYDAGYVLSRRPDLIAAWIEPNLDMRWGLSRQRYEAGGYHLEYLVNAGDRPAPPNVLEASGLDPDAARALIERGYEYAVLRRQPDPRRRLGLD